MPKWFKYEEFDSPDAPGSGQLISPVLADKLDNLREIVGVPLIVTSGVRTAGHNNAVGGVDGSAHVRGMAVDFSAVDSGTKFKIVKAALSLGFNRIGVGARFVHLDIDDTKPPNVMWTY